MQIIFQSPTLKVKRDKEGIRFLLQIGNFEQEFWFADIALKDLDVLTIKADESFASEIRRLVDIIKENDKKHEL